MQTNHSAPSKASPKNPANRNRNRLAILALLLFLLACALLVFKMQLNDAQSRNTFPLPVGFSGEYRQGDGEWQPLTEDSALNALEGDLYLRGNLDYIFTTKDLYLFLDHIKIEVFINGELYYPQDQVEGYSTCGSQWIWFNLPPEMEQTDLLEIHLTNDHAWGNPDAYTHFLRNIFIMNADAFDQYILSTGYLSILDYSELREYVPDAFFILYGPICQTIGKAIMLLSILLLGIALLDLLHDSLFGTKFLLVSFFSLAASVIMQLNGSSTNSGMHSVLLTSNIPKLLMMLLVPLATGLLSTQLRDTRKRISQGLTLLSFTVTWLVVIVHILTTVSLCETNLLRPYFFFAILLAGLLLSLEDVLRNKRITSLALSVLLCAMAFELLNALQGWLLQGILFRIVFVLEFAMFVIWAVCSLPRQFREAKRAAELEKELEHSRISVALSQIQPHFLFNALNAIQYLCKENSTAAYDAVGQFALYLRGNLAVFQQDTLVPFEKELEHTKAYLHLEMLRFGDKLTVEWDIKATDFRLPALTVQPIVENAIKHGICNKEGDGTVKISTRMSNGRIEIIIEDDGCGFDPDKLPDDGRQHIGLSNVRTRLEAMSHASLAIESSIGSGTKAVIRIPYTSAPL